MAFTTHAMFAATDVFIGVLFMPAVIHVVAVRRSGEETVLMKLAKDHTERGRNAFRGFWLDTHSSEYVW